MTIGYIEAWREWFSGREVDPNARLWFMSVLWWSRAGTIAAFVAGATVILDLAGPKQLRKFGKRRDALEVLAIPVAFVAFVFTLFPGIFFIFNPLRQRLDDTFFGGVLTVALLGVLFVASYGVAALVLKATAAAAANSLSSKNPAFSLRVLALLILAIGFHFSLLGA